MSCTCGHTADHHANKGKNPALSFCVESCCPCGAYKPRRNGPRGLVLLSLLMLAVLGCSAGSVGLTQEIKSCQDVCNVARVECETPHHSMCAHCCEAWDLPMCETDVAPANPSCLVQCEAASDAKFCLSDFDACMGRCAP